MSEELIEHLCNISRLERAEATRLIAEIVAYYQESPEEFVLKRHRELQLAGSSNSKIYEILKREMSQRCFSAPDFSERQLRRMIYG